MTYIIILIALFSYTIIEYMMKRWGKLGSTEKLWSSHWAFLWGGILLALIFLQPGPSQPFGAIMFAKDALVHIVRWVIGLLLFYYFSNFIFQGDVASHWKSLKFFNFSLVNPIFEEILFRGIILTSLLNSLPNAKYEELLVMVSSLLFAFFHLNYEDKISRALLNRYYFFRLIMIFVVGNAIGYLVLLTGSIWMSILMHILINTVGTVYYNIRLIKNKQLHL